MESLNKIVFNTERRNMAYLFEPQTVLLTQPETIWCEFRDNEGVLTLVNNPKIIIYDPNGTTAVSSSTMTLESTGIYYYIFTATAGAAQGDYQAWFSGELGGMLRTIDGPKSLYVRQMPWDRGLKYEFIQSVRKAIGDFDSSNYRIRDRDLIYFISDAIKEMQMQLPMGYTVTVDPDGIIFNKILTTRAEVLFKWQTVLLILEAMINKYIYDVGIISLPDIKIDKTRHFDSKLRRLQDQAIKVQNMINEIRTSDISGIELITYGKGETISLWWD